jgi:fatty-acyl-CoA synthase
MPNWYNVDLQKNQANYTALSPLSFLRWTASVYPQRLALIHGKRHITWAQTYERCRRFASALAQCGIGAGDTVAIMCSNIIAMYEAHFGIPMSGAVINALNTRLDAEAIAFQLNHGEAKVLLTEREFAPIIEKALTLTDKRPLVIDIDDAQYFRDTADAEGERKYVANKLLGEMEYEAFLQQGEPNFAFRLPGDEWDAIALGYTSGTTGNPKGVVTHHRGAYLSSVGNVLAWQGMSPLPVYLWTLPMFHCNGWTFPWVIAAVSGTNVCLRKVDAKLIFDLIREHKVTHYCGAPIVQATLINAPPEWRQGIDHRVNVFVAGAAPPVAVIEGMERMGFHLMHVYGLTEVYGPAAVCPQHPEWDALSLEERAQMNGRQGKPYQLQEDMMVADPVTLQPVPKDGETMGEIFFRGNMTMKGYLKNKKATEESFAGGWFHSGDLAVWYPDGYAKIKDRSKDIIISGGENISSLEVEDVLHRHPAVMLAAVVARHDEKWGETPCAFVELKEGAQATEAEMIEFCRARLARFKVPKTVIFGPIPKTSTGKIQKFVLREQARKLAGTA